MMTITRRTIFTNTILMACILSFAIVGTFHDTARASVKHLVVGGVIGAGAVLAWPTIVGGVTAIAGGVGAAGAAVAGAVATGGAMAGGAIAGVGTAVGGAVTAGFGAIGGAVAAITASPLFVPALIIAGVAIAGFFIYKHFSKKSASKAAEKANENPFETQAPTSGGRITDAAPTVVTDKNTTPGAATTTADKNVSATPEQVFTQSTKPVDNQDSSSKSLKDKYTAAYQNYVRLLQNDTTNGSSPEIMQAFQQLKQSQDEYRAYLDAHPEAAK